MIAALLLGTLALAGNDMRDGAGIGIAGGVSPIEPAFTGTPRPYPTFSIHHVGLIVRGGTVRRGRKGRVRRTPSHQRIGYIMAAGTSPTLMAIDASNRAHWGVGMLAGGQWDWGDGYVTTSVGLGIGGYHQWLTTPTDDLAMTTFGPWLRPTVAIGIPLSDEAQLEVGPSFSTVVPMMTSHKNGVPRGHPIGQATLDVTLVLGSVGATPR